MGKSRVFVVGDLHFPWVRPQQLRALYAAIRRFRPTYVVQVGDLYDFYSLSKYARSYDVITPRREIARGRAMAVAFWRSVRRAAPRARLHVLRGNHDERPLKRALEANPALESLVAESVDRLFAFDGVTDQRDPRCELIIDGVVYQHGYRKHGDHVRHNGRSTVVGHLHVGGVVYRRLGRKTLFEMNCGLVADLSAPVFFYRPQKRFSNWTVGYGTVDQDGPRFVALA